jgi:hypothetical protein
VVHINQRRDTAANWTSSNPILQRGEVGWETDTLKSKLGDGTKAWNALSYTAASSGGGSSVTATPHPTFTGVGVITIGAGGGGGTITVIPLAPTWAGGTLTIPAVTGIQYKKNGVNIAAGNSSDSTTDIAITCVPLTGYDLASGYATSWTLNAGPPVITAWSPSGFGKYAQDLAIGATLSVTATGTGLSYQWGYVPAGTLNANIAAVFVPVSGNTTSSVIVGAVNPAGTILLAMGGVTTAISPYIMYASPTVTDLFTNSPRIICKVTNAGGTVYGADHILETQSGGAYPPSTGSIGTCATYVNF